MAESHPDEGPDLVFGGFAGWESGVGGADECGAEVRII